jgi:hypothetical protein
MLADFESALRNLVQWYMESLDINQFSWCLVVVTDSYSELEPLSAEQAKVFGELEDNSEGRMKLCADDGASVIPLCIGRILAVQVCEFFDLIALSLQMYANPIFVIHVARAGLCAVARGWSEGRKVCDGVQDEWKLRGGAAQKAPRDKTAIAT